MPRPLWQHALKRAIDVAGATVALTLGAPIMAATALAVARELGRPVLFRQVRPGRDGRPFTLVKFRTMRDATDRAGRPLPDGERLSRFGQRLRATSLDELPQFWNVLKGDMSLVGPRPLLTQYLPLYSAEQARRHDVKPGITGWAQVNGRNALSWDDKFALDVWYVDHASLALDLRILIATVRAALARDGISHGAEATMPPFTGAGHAAAAPGSRG
ncbi:MAG: sugar transferase [Myxococcales bacterium]|nr:sugar transferase [Myxococcales bacterium]